MNQLIFYTPITLIENGPYLITNTPIPVGHRLRRDGPTTLTPVGHRLRRDKRSKYTPGYLKQCHARGGDLRTEARR